jgi:hypothetical protein
LTVSLNGSVNVGGVIYVDSSSSSALTARDNAFVHWSSIKVVGGYSRTGNAVINPTPTTGAPVFADPLAALPVPSGSLPNRGSVNLTGNSTATLLPGVYDQIRVTNNARATFTPGVYVLKGGGLSVSLNGSITGSGVVIYNAGSHFPNPGGSFAGIALSDNATANLTAAASGTYAGVVVFQARDNTRALSLSSNASVMLTGTIYASAALLTVSGDGSLHGPVIADRLTVTDNGVSSLSASGGDTASNAAGELLARDLWVYVEASPGAFTADERARIGDAVAGLADLLQPFSVTVGLVDSPDEANVVIDAAATSPVGGLAQGALGCFDSATGEITVIRGWAWYAGADPAGIRAGEFDFQTAVTHELGHALGLAHSADPNSVMHGTLLPGVARRALTTADLNISPGVWGRSAPDAATVRHLPPLPVGVPGESLAAIGLLLTEREEGAWATHLLAVPAGAGEHLLGPQAPVFVEASAANGALGRLFAAVAPVLDRLFAAGPVAEQRPNPGGEPRCEPAPASPLAAQRLGRSPLDEVFESPGRTFSVWHPLLSCAQVLDGMAGAAPDLITALLASAAALAAAREAPAEADGRRRPFRR